MYKWGSMTTTRDKLHYKVDRFRKGDIRLGGETSGHCIVSPFDDSELVFEDDNWQ